MLMNHSPSYLFPVSIYYKLYAVLCVECNQLTEFQTKMSWMIHFLIHLLIQQYHGRITCDNVITISTHGPVLNVT